MAKPIVVQTNQWQEGETVNIEIWIEDSRRITVSLNSAATSVQIPNSNVKVDKREYGFYARAPR